jgi:hypothetical protein
MEKLIKMKQNSAEQPYEAYERLRKELKEVNQGLYSLTNVFSRNFKIRYYNFFTLCKPIKINQQTKLALIEVLESKKKDIENELNKLVNGN